MNIWLINHYAVPPKYYPLARTTFFAKYLGEYGHKVTIFCASAVHNSSINLIESGEKFKTETVDGIDYVYVKTSQYSGNGLGRIKNMFQFARRLKKICGKFEVPDYIIASTATPLAAMQGIRLSKRYKCKNIVEVSDLWPESFIDYGILKRNSMIAKVLYRYEKKLYKKADKLIFTMEGGKNYITDKKWQHKIDINKVYHINNGVDLSGYNAYKEEYILEDKDLDSPQFKVVYCGSIRLVNNLMLLVKAAEQLKDNDSIKFIVYGEGGDRIPLQEYCKQNELNNIVFKGHVEKKYVPYLLSKADCNIIIVRQSDVVLKYGCSLNKLFDYFASGKPIISNLKANFDLIQKYDCGITTDSQEAELLATAILQLYDLPIDKRRQMSENAKAAAEDYDFKVLTKKLLEIMEK